MQYTACALDCYDGCVITYDNDKIKGDIAHPFTKGSLCTNVNTNIHKAARITEPSINGKTVSMREALDHISKILNENTLLLRGSGNVAVMQEITNFLIEKIGGTVTDGSLCDGAGEAGILEIRGINLTLPI